MNISITDKILTMLPFTEEWDEFKKYLLKEKELSDISLSKIMKEQGTIEDIIRVSDASSSDLHDSLILMDKREEEISRYFGF